MSGVDSQYRYERKFLIKARSERVVEAVVRQHPYLFRSAYTDRAVNNVYFDTPKLKSLHDNIQGVRNRTKTRIRWYGDLRGLAPDPKLEFKIKRGLVGTKEIYSLPPLDTAGQEIERNVEAQLRAADLPTRASLQMAMIRPTLLNSYVRKYFVSADGRFRITIDRDLCFFPARNPWVRRRTRQTCATVLELKYAEEDDREACAVSQHLGFRLSRNSKYVTGMDLLYQVADTY